MKRTILHSIMAIVVAIVMAACSSGGSSGGGSSVSSTANTISGVASAGSPIASVAISVLSIANGLIYHSTTLTGTDGSFSINIDPVAYPAPYILRVVNSGETTSAYYAYVASLNTAGVIISPVSSAAIGLAANSNPDSVFTNNTSISASAVTSMVNLIYQAGQNVYSALGVTDSSKITNNSSYVANGTGIDSALDILKINYSSPSAGDILVTTKHSSKSVQITSASTSVTALPIAMNVSSAIVTGINSNNACIASAANANSATNLALCLDSTFKDAGVTTSTAYLARLTSYIGNIQSVSPASVVWCDFTNSALTFASPAGSLANQTGVCYAKSRFYPSSGSSVVAGLTYKFTVNSTGNGIGSVALYGNQLDDQLSIVPALGLKKRVDGLAGNANTITSGYQFYIGTALSSTTKILSAQIDILDTSNTTLGSFYMQCQQGTSCIDSALSICLNASSTCGSGFDLTSDSILSINSTLSGQIISAMQTGSVRARVTAYNGVLSNGAKATVYTKLVPIVDLPIAQSDANSVIFPSLDTSSQQALASWAGTSTLSVNISPGNATLYGAGLSAYDGSTIVNKGNAIISGGTSSINFSGIGISGGTAIVSGCPTTATYRAIYLRGAYHGVAISTKYFGSCSNGDY